MKKRLISILLSLSMVLTLLPETVLSHPRPALLRSRSARQAPPARTDTPANLEAYK